MSAPSSLSSRVWPRFTQTCLAASLIAAIAGAAWTLRMDPYWALRREPPWLAATQGVNRVIDVEMRRAKVLQITTRPAATVLIGSSTVYRGLDPADLRGETYNAGISSLMADEIATLAALVARRPSVRRVVIGLDYFMFTALPPPPPIDGSAATGTGVIRAFLGSVLSLRTLENAWPGEIAQAAEPGSWHFSGFKDTPDFDPARTRVIAAVQDLAAMRYEPARLRHLARALDLLSDRDVRLYLSPMTRAQLALAERAGRSAEIAAWRRDVSALVATRNVSFADLVDGHPFDDFDPERGSSAYWIDNIHFKPAVGRWILQRIGLAAAP